MCRKFFYGRIICREGSESGTAWIAWRDTTHFSLTFSLSAFAFFPGGFGFGGAVLSEMPQFCISIWVSTNKHADVFTCDQFSSSLSLLNLRLRFEKCPGRAFIQTLFIWSGGKDGLFSKTIFNNSLNTLLKA